MNDEVLGEKVKQLEADIKEIKEDLKTMPDKIAEKVNVKKLKKKKRITNSNVRENHLQD